MKILLAGASGFIGKNFILKAQKDWQIWGIYRSNPNFAQFALNFPKLSILQCNLKNLQEVKNKLTSLPDCFDIGVFVWGNSDTGLSCREPLEDLNDNVDSLINLLTCLRFRKFIFMSSGTVYLGHQGLTNSEVSCTPLTPYAITKLASELYVRFFAEKTNQIDKYVNIRFFGAYGPMEPTRKIFTKLIKRFCVEKKTDYLLIGDGTNFIDAMYVDDLIEALQKIILSEKANLTIDLCRGEPLTVRQLVLRIAKTLGIENLQLKHRGEPKEFISFYASPERAEKIFGFKARISLEEGITRLKDYLLGEMIHV
jgi:nucleoside-diphosphate-sugar epimerase